MGAAVTEGVGASVGAGVGATVGAGSGRRGNRSRRRSRRGAGQVDSDDARVIDRGIGIRRNSEKSEKREEGEG